MENSQIKESEKLDKYRDFARDLKNLWNIKEDRNINNKILGTIPKNLEKKTSELEIHRRIETI